MKSIFRKEISNYFSTLTGYIFLAIFVMASGIVFTTGNLLSQNSDIKHFFSVFFTILIFLIPMLTMRQFSEELKMKTLQLLFTLPLSLRSIVLGKYFATMAVVGFGLIFTLIFPVTLAFYGTFELMVILGNYLGLVLLISAFVSIGLFISSLTENQIISSVVSYAVILGLWMVDAVTPFILNDYLSGIVNRFSLRINFIEFTYGIFNPGSVLYYLSVTALFLFLTAVSLDSRRA